MFGPAVTDANGAGISGAWTNRAARSRRVTDWRVRSSTSRSTFCRAIPTRTVRSTRRIRPKRRSWRTTRRLGPPRPATARSSTSTETGRSTLRTGAVATTNVNLKTSNITNPSNPSGGLAGGSGFTALALGVQESGSIEQQLVDARGQQRQFAQRGAGHHHYGDHEQQWGHGIGQRWIFEWLDVEQPQSRSPRVCRDRRGGVGLRPGRLVGLIGPRSRIAPYGRGSIARMQRKNEGNNARNSERGEELSSLAGGGTEDRPGGQMLGNREICGN